MTRQTSRFWLLDRETGFTLPGGYPTQKEALREAALANVMVGRFVYSVTPKETPVPDAS